MKIYVGNLPFSTTFEDLKKLFGEYGDVSEATIIADKFSGRSKGFGFVTMDDDEAAKKAISELNGKDFSGRELKVSEAKPLDPDAPRRPSSSRPPQRRNFNRRESRY